MRTLAAIFTLMPLALAFWVDPQAVRATSPL
jgi:hypothetical protein